VINIILIPAMLIHKERVIKRVEARYLLVFVVNYLFLKIKNFTLKL